jgi:2-polyprenyl-6-methoxyphenol hydroxylase-like FAD-dependent oxidoreductase
LKSYNMARIVIAGGSLGGLMAANLLHRAGHDVHVLEKATGPMDGRGAGIVTHPILAEGLRRCGMAATDELGVTVQQRITLDSQGEALGTLDMPQVFSSWSRLYQMLHSWLPASCYHAGVQVNAVTQREEGTAGGTASGTKNGTAGATGSVHLQTNQGEWHADLLIAADGIRSTVRAQLWPRIQPEYAGYVAWRGVCDEAVLSQRTRTSLFDKFGFCLPPGEQIIGYPVAGLGNRTDVGHRAYNFVWYRPAPAPDALRSLLTDADGVHHPQGIPPHKVSWLHVADMRADARRLLAPQFAEMIEKTAQPFLQPIHDLVSQDTVSGRIALTGDAAFVARPHVGAGVTKAMQDAMALTDAITQHGATPQALRAYAQVRQPAGRHIIFRARRLGAYMQSCGQTPISASATPTHNADTADSASTVQRRDAIAVMAETAINIDSLPPESAYSV